MLDLPFNALKSQLVRITNQTTPDDNEYIIMDAAVKPVKEAKWLGIIVDNHLTFNSHITAAKNQAKMRTRELGKVIKRPLRKFLPTLFHSFVVTKLLYGSQVAFRETEYQNNKINAVYNLLKYKIGRTNQSFDNFMKLYNIKKFIFYSRINLLCWIYKFVFKKIDLGDELFCDLEIGESRTRSAKILQKHVKPIALVKKINRKVSAHSFVKTGFPERAVKLWNGLPLTDDILPSTGNVKKDLLKFKKVITVHCLVHWVVCNGVGWIDFFHQKRFFNHFSSWLKINSVLN